MRLFSVLFLVAALFVSAASAELLTTANPIGQGKWMLEAAYLNDANVNNSSSYTMTTPGCYIGYGVTDKLNLYASAGLVTVNGLPTILGVQLAQTITAIGLSGLYNVMDENNGSPVSVAVGAGYRTLNYSMTIPAGVGVASTTTANGNQMLVGVGVSKIIAPFAPYSGFTYRSTSQSGNAVSSQMDLTVGTALAWSMQGAVLVEYTMQSITPNGGSAYTSNELALGVAYKI